MSIIFGILSGRSSSPGTPTKRPEMRPWVVFAMCSDQGVETGKCSVSRTKSLRTSPPAVPWAWDGVPGAIDIEPKNFSLLPAVHNICKFVIVSVRYCGPITRAVAGITPRGCKLACPCRIKFACLSSD
jgi:hypothetical protein